MPFPSPPPFPGGHAACFSGKATEKRGNSVKKRGGGNAIKRETAAGREGRLCVKRKNRKRRPGMEPIAKGGGGGTGFDTRRVCSANKIFFYFSGIFSNCLGYLLFSSKSPMHSGRLVLLPSPLFPAEGLRIVRN